MPQPCGRSASCRGGGSCTGDQPHSAGPPPPSAFHPGPCGADPRKRQLQAVGKHKPSPGVSPAVEKGVGGQVPGSRGRKQPMQGSLRGTQLRCWGRCPIKACLEQALSPVYQPRMGDQKGGATPCWAPAPREADCMRGGNPTLLPGTHGIRSPGAAHPHPFSKAASPD